MTYDDRAIEREARKRFGRFDPGDPRGILADVPIHFQTEPATADVRKAVGSFMGAYADKRRKAAEALAALEAATTEHQRKMEEIKETGNQARLTQAAKPTEPAEERKPYEAGGYLYTPKIGGGFDREPARFRPSTFVNYADRVTPEQLETARRGAIADATANLGKYLGTVTVKKGHQMVDESGNLIWTSDLNGRRIPYNAQIDTEVSRGVSSLSPAAQELFQRGAAIIGAKAARELSADDAARELDALVTTSMPIDARQVYMGLKQYLKPKLGLRVGPSQQGGTNLSNAGRKPVVDPDVQAFMDQTGADEATAKAYLGL